MHPRYEVIPLAGAEEAVLDHVPSEVTVHGHDVAEEGLDPERLDLVERIAAERRTSVVPHLAARHVSRRRGSIRRRARRASAGRGADRRACGMAARHVRDHRSPRGARRARSGARAELTACCVMAGDAPEPAGAFDGALPLLEALAELGSPFEHVGMTGYPESHAFLSDDVATRSLLAKAEFSTYIVTQICFDPSVTATWMDTVWARGVRLRSTSGFRGLSHDRSSCACASGSASATRCVR